MFCFYVDSMGHQIYFIMISCQKTGPQWGVAVLQWTKRASEEAITSQLCSVRPLQDILAAVKAGTVSAKWSCKIQPDRLLGFLWNWFEVNLLMYRMNKKIFMRFSHPGSSGVYQTPPESWTWAGVSQGSLRRLELQPRMSSGHPPPCSRVPGRAWPPCTWSRLQGGSTSSPWFCWQNQTVRDFEKTHSCIGVNSEYSTGKVNEGTNFLSPLKTLTKNFEL